MLGHRNERVHTVNDFGAIRWAHGSVSVLD